MADNDPPIGGTYGTIPHIELEPLYLAPATKGEKNTLRFPLIPVACWRLDDVRFEFDSSIVRPETRLEMKDLAELRKLFPKSPMSIFGHADPTGDEVYNKELSGRRATAIYGALTRDVDLWEKLYTKPFGGDTWKTKSLQIMLLALGFDPKGTDGVYGANTTKAMQEFQKTKTPNGTGADTSENRKRLFLAYMNFLCVDSAGTPFTVPKTEFLGRNADPNGKADYQGCSEFNPVLIFSKDKTAEFKKPQNKPARDAANGPNRRVTALLFRPDSVVPPEKWPCPRATEGVAACKKRFWSDHQRRLAPGDQDRTYEKDKDTFACRFYHRLTVHSPCEETVKYWVIRVLESSQEPLNKRKPLANTAFTVTAEDGGPPNISGNTDAQGILRIRATSDKAKFKLSIAGAVVLVDAGDLFPSGASEMANRQRLCNMGYGPPDIKTWKDSDADAAYRMFQKHHTIQETGSANAETVAKLKEIHGS